MIEQDAAARKQVVGFAVVHGDPVGVNFGATIRTARIKRSRLPLWNVLHIAEHFA
jgi:hypothetical protein